MSTDVRVSWFPEVAIAAVDMGAAEGTVEAMEYLRDAAYTHVPRDTGHLAETGTVTGEGGEAVLSYDTVYAQALHAHPEWNFQDGREAHWLESAIDETKDGFEQVLGAAVARYL